VSVVGLIPARGASQGIPRKNLARLGGKPLVAWTIAAALESERLTRAVVSTDDRELADVARAHGAEVLDRPPELAADETPMRDVVAHAVRELAPETALVLLQPTSPLRTSRHVDEAVERLLASGADAVVSVVEVPHRYGAASLMRLDGERLVRLDETSYPGRADKPVLYARNGPAILALRADRIGDDLYAGDLRPYVMDAADSVDVDEPFDLELAEFLLSRR
jgi:CMP-N,N'-diacetyllegionaminic acid synthase